MHPPTHTSLYFHVKFCAPPCHEGLFSCSNSQCATQHLYLHFNGVLIRICTVSHNVIYIAWYWWILHARQALICSRFVVHLGNDTLYRNDIDINYNYGNPLKHPIQCYSSLVSEWVYTVVLALNYSLNP